MQGLFISGSGTDVGKTFVASYIIQALNTKYSVVARKPIESDCQKNTTGLIPKDAILLNNACIKPEPIDKVCQFRFSACASGEKASETQGVKITLDDLVVASQPTDKADFVVIEGAGGLYSPLSRNSLNADLAEALGLPVVLVVKDELGAVNQALLSLAAARHHQLNIGMLVLNQITPNNLDNAQALSTYTSVKVVNFNQANKTDFVDKVLQLFGN